MFYISPIQIRWKKNGKKSKKRRRSRGKRDALRDSALMERNKKIEFYNTLKPNTQSLNERWGAGVETQKNARGEIGGWGRVPFNEPYASSLSTIYDGA